AEKIRKITEYRDCPILFVTNSSYSLSGFSQLTTYHSYKKFNYISLPITRIDVQGKLGLYLEDIIQSQSAKQNADRAIFLAHTKGETFLSVNEILFAEVQNKICTIHTLKGSFQMLRKNLNEIMEIVDDDFFIRCHRGFAVNIRQLKGIEKVDRRIWKAVLENCSETCLISKTYLSEVTDKYKAFQVK
ncbi:MAG: LytTR family DNA-binding domain-containing protein, partial [Bacillota bacterium]